MYSGWKPHVKMAEAWKKLKDKVKDKRTKTTKTGLQETQRRPKGEELTVQHLSAHVSGKAQKYTGKYTIHVTSYTSNPPPPPLALYVL